MSEPDLERASSKRSISAREISDSVLRYQITNRRSLSRGSLPLSGSLRRSRIWALVCFVMFSSISKKLSNWRSLMPFNKAVAMFMCMSSIAFRSRSSGSRVMAALRCEADELESFCKSSIEEAPVFFVISAASSLYFLSSVSMSSATCGKDMPAFRDQKKSFEFRSYDLFVVPLARLFSSIGVSTVIRFKCILSTSWTRL